MTMPTRNVNEMSRSTPPPKTNRARAAKNVVLAVMIVRANTFRIAALTTSRRVPDGLSFNSSRIRSKTTTVSLIE